jgi:hypothetical protein
MTCLFIFTIWIFLQIPLGSALGKYLKLARARR